MSAHHHSRVTRSRSRGLTPRFAVTAALVAGSALALAGAHSATAQTLSPLTVQLGTSADFSVLASTTVTNTGPSVIGQNVGLWDGSSITGFPPGIVTPPATIEATNGVAEVAQDDLTTAFDDAAGRSVSAEIKADLVGLTLAPGVYSAANKGSLGLSGQLVLDGQNDPDAVFIFQTDSTLITSSSSTIALIRGASECNVFWQIGSSATLGTGSFFVGTILANQSVTVTNSTVVHGRALARNAAVTLDNNVFREPSCDRSTDDAPTATAPATTTPVTTTPGSATTVPASPVATDSVDADRDIPTTSFVFNPTDVTLPATGTGSLVTQSGVGFAVLLIGLAALVVARRRQPA